MKEKPSGVNFIKAATDDDDDDDEIRKNIDIFFSCLNICTNR